MRREVHFSRLLDIISGSALAGLTNKVQRSALYRDFDLARLNDKKLRELIDSNLPSFYIVNVDTIVQELSKGLGISNFESTEDYVKSKKPEGKELENFLHTTITNSITKLPKLSFTDSYQKLDALYSKFLDTLASRKDYIGYRNAATRFGFDLRNLLKSTGVYIASDASSVVSNLGSNSFLIVGPSFNATKTKVNDLLNADLRTAFSASYDINLKKYDAKADAKDRFTIGDFINAGHTGAYTPSGELIGINMPATQEKQFLLSGTGKEDGLETAISDLYLDAGYGIEFNQNFTKTAKNLLNMQFSFVVTMPTKFNTATLRINEVNRINTYIKGTILPTISEQVTKKFAGGLLEDAALGTKASPNVFQYITSVVVNALQGKPTKNIVKSSNANKNTSVKVPGVIVKKKSAPIKIATKSGGLKIQPESVRTKRTQISLTSLQNLINESLVQRVKANMGRGERGDILNLRTGRFAESVKVERMSQGRQGMITAYYSYMKNPYATFSQGGEQSSPSSRDPKLLIAKSIREIAAKQVADRLRSVVV